MLPHPYISNVTYIEPAWILPYNPLVAILLSGEDCAASAELPAPIFIFVTKKSLVWSLKVNTTLLQGSLSLLQQKCHPL